MAVPRALLDFLQVALGNQGQVIGIDHRHRASPWRGAQHRMPHCAYYLSTQPRFLQGLSTQPPQPARPARTVPSLANAKAAEDHPQQIIRGEFARDGAQVVLGQAQFFGQQIEGRVRGLQQGMGLR